MVLGSAYDILSSGWPPRCTFVNYPLGHPAGKPFDTQDQLRLVRKALLGFSTHRKAGQVSVPFCDWGSTTDFCAVVGSSPEAIHSKRDKQLRYQCPEDLQLAIDVHGDAAAGVVSAEAIRQVAALKDA